LEGAGDGRLRPRYEVIPRIRPLDPNLERLRGLDPSLEFGAAPYAVNHDREE